VALTKSYKYIDNDGDEITVSEAPEWVANIVATLEARDVDEDEGATVYVTSRDSVPLALNMLGYDRPEDGPLMPASVSVDDAVAFLADSQAARDLQVKNAAALLMAVDAYDKRQARLATAAERREAAAHRLSMAVNRVQSSSAFGNDEIGKLREALGRYDAELAN
jgi:hypothetical protein